MNISIFGAGYAGLVTGACFAEMGNNVIRVDNDAAKVGQLKPIHEPGLDDLIGGDADCPLRAAPTAPEGTCRLATRAALNGRQRAPSLSIRFR